MRNTVTGFLRNLRSGREMLDAFHPDRVQQATRTFLKAAEDLLRFWDDTRTGKALAAFHGPEKDYLDASATLTEMHMVIEPVKKLDGKGLLDERERLASLAAFPDQGLIAPVMSAVKNRAAQITAYTDTPEEGDQPEAVGRKGPRNAPTSIFLKKSACSAIFHTPSRKCNHA